MLLIAAPLFFAAIGATQFFPNTTTATPSSTSSSHHGLITSGVTSAYYNPAHFVNPYFYIVINTSGDLVLSSLRSCSSIWGSSFAKWLATAEVTTGPIVPGTTYTTTLLPWISSQAASTETFSRSLSTWTSIIPGTIATIFPETETLTSAGYGPLYYVQDHLDFTASEPCCESCTLYGGSVQVYYWPTTETQSPPVSTLVNSAGFTFVSPSVYVAFQSLHAADLCGDVGPQFAATTLAFSPGELSTSIGYFVSTSLAWEVPIALKGLVWTQATFGDQTDCEDKVSVFWNIGGMPFSDITAASSMASSLLSEFPMPGTGISDLINSNSFTYNPCKPTLSVPTQVLTLDSLWNGCLPPVSAFFDPPYKLSPGNGLVAFATTTSTASPGPSPEPVIASVTVSTSPAPATSSTPPVIPPSLSPVVDPSASSVVVVASPPIPAAGSDPSSSTFTEIQMVQVVTIDSSTLLPSSNPPAQVVGDPAGNSPGATVPVASSPLASDPDRPDPLQNTAGQSLSIPSSPQVAAPSQISPISGSDSADAIATVEYIISSQTLRANGPAITVAGTVISLLPGATSVLVGTHTVALSGLIGATTNTVASIGGIIISVGGFATNAYTSTASVTATGNGNYNGTLHLGGAARTAGEKSTWSLGLLLGVGVLGVCWL